MNPLLIVRILKQHTKCGMCKSELLDRTTCRPEVKRSNGNTSDVNNYHVLCYACLLLIDKSNMRDSHKLSGIPHRDAIHHKDNKRVKEDHASFWKDKE